MYIYKEYNDSFAYGEEIVKLFEERDRAIAHLKARVCEHYEDAYVFKKIEQIKELAGPFADVELREDYVCVPDGNGYAFWGVEEIETEEAKERAGNK